MKQGSLAAERKMNIAFNTAKKILLYLAVSKKEKDSFRVNVCLKLLL